jgi:hypothetical protein
MHRFYFSHFLMINLICVNGIITIIVIIILWRAAWKPEYWNQNIRLSLVNGFAKHFSTATNKSGAGQRLAEQDMFRQ